MEHFNNDDLEYVVDDGFYSDDASDFEDDHHAFSSDDKRSSSSADSPDSDSDSDFETVISLSFLFLKSLLASSMVFTIHWFNWFWNRVVIIVRKLTPLLRKRGTGRISREFHGRSLIIAETSTVSRDWSSTWTMRISLVHVKTYTRLIFIFIYNLEYYYYVCSFLILLLIFGVFCYFWFTGVLGSAEREELLWLPVQYQACQVHNSAFSGTVEALFVAIH